MDDTDYFGIRKQFSLYNLILHNHTPNKMFHIAKSAQTIWILLQSSTYWHQTHLFVNTLDYNIKYKFRMNALY